jgi:protoporphyrinogen oxidase
MKNSPRVGIIGAGPAGLTAAYWLKSRHDITSSIYEASSEIGGISQTVNRQGWRFDIGGHRFFTKVALITQIWKEILPEEDFLTRKRLSRIMYNGKFFDYPLKPLNALTGLGLVEAIRCLISYVVTQIKPPKDQSNFETWVAARFGWRLYRIFFKTYTEKVWGVPANEIQADWAAQRIKNLDLKKAIFNAFKPQGRRGSEVISLIESFEYPRLGPGMMWEACADYLEKDGIKISMMHSAAGIQVRSDSTLVLGLADGASAEYDHLVSSMPIGELVQIIQPSAPAAVIEAAKSLKHRDFLSVALVVPSKDVFPDNWIYIHSPNVKVGRIQNFESWSPEMVPDEGFTCLGLEYFVNVGDELWDMKDTDLISFASSELAELGLSKESDVVKGYVVRMPKAYPVYDENYAIALKTIRSWLDENHPNIHPVGRNGLHRYNNTDHSMMTAILASENIATGKHNDVWNVNVDEDYHETTSEISNGIDTSINTGRSAPIFTTGSAKK